MKRTCTWLLALAGVLGLAGTTQAGPYGFIPLFFPQLFGQDSTRTTLPAQSTLVAQGRLDFGFPVYGGERVVVPVSVAVQQKPGVDAERLADFLWDCVDAMSDLAPEIRFVFRSMQPTTPYHLAAAMVLEYLSAVDAAERSTTPGGTVAQTLPASVPLYPPPAKCKACEGQQACPGVSSCPLGYTAKPTYIGQTPITQSGTFSVGYSTTAFGTFAEACDNPPACPACAKASAAKACKCCEKCDDCKDCCCAKKPCKCCEKCESCKDCTCSKTAGCSGDNLVPGMVLSKERIGKVIIWSPEYHHPPLPPMMPPMMPSMTHPRYNDGDMCVGGVVIRAQPCDRENLNKFMIWTPGVAPEYLHPPMPPMPPMMPPYAHAPCAPCGPPAFTAHPFVTPLPCPDGDFTYYGKQPMPAMPLPCGDFTYYGKQPMPAMPPLPPLPNPYMPAPPYQVMNPMMPSPFDELRELHYQREMIASAIDQVEQELARMEAQRLEAQRLAVQRIETQRQTFQVHTAPATCQANSVHLMTEHFEAHCNSLRCVPGDPHRIMLEGSVRLTCKKCGQNVQIEAPCVVVNMKDGTFTVESHGQSAPTPPQAVQGVRDLPVTERVEMVQDASGRCIPVVTWTRTVSAPLIPPAPVAPAAPAMPKSMRRAMPAGEMLPMPRPVAPPRPVVPVNVDGDK
jgi:hypothetical protein